MITRYCPVCDKVSSVESIIYHRQHTSCFICKKPLIFLGREKVSLSVQEIFDQYDATHDFNPLKDYKGMYKVYGSQESQIRLLECEDVLLHNPENRDALIYISKNFWRKGQFKLAKEYVKRIFSYHSVNQNELVHYITVLFSLKQFKSIIAVINKSKILLDDFYYYHSLAMAYLGLKNRSNALKCFYKTYSLCKDAKRKEKIKQVIKQLSTIDKKNSL